MEPYQVVLIVAPMVILAYVTLEYLKRALPLDHELRKAEKQNDERQGL